MTSGSAGESTLSGSCPPAGRSCCEADIRSADDLRPVADFAPDTVFHMAALHFIPYCNAHPAGGAGRQRPGPGHGYPGGSRRAAEVIRVPLQRRDLRVRRRPWPETAPPKPDEIYGITKWMGEQIMAPVPCRPARGAHGGGPAVQHLRPPGDQPPRAARRHEGADAGKPIELGNLWPQRDLIFVTDTAGLVATAPGDPGSGGLQRRHRAPEPRSRTSWRPSARSRGQPLDVRQVPERMRDG